MPLFHMPCVKNCSVDEETCTHLYVQMFGFVSSYIKNKLTKMLGCRLKSIRIPAKFSFVPMLCKPQVASSNPSPWFPCHKWQLTSPLRETANISLKFFDKDFLFKNLLQVQESFYKTLLQMPITFYEASLTEDICSHFSLN